MKFRIIMLIMKFILLLIPITILFNNGFILEGGFLALYILVEIGLERTRRLEERVERLEGNEDGS